MLCSEENMDTFVAMIRVSSENSAAVRLSLQTVVSETMKQGATKFIATEKKATTVSRGCCDSISYRFHGSTIVISREINKIR